MDFLFAIGGAVIIALIIVIVFTLAGDNKPGDSNFAQKFTGSFFVLIVIVVLGSLSELAGCSSEEEPDYPMRYERP